jgi:predicted RNA methylase
VSPSGARLTGGRTEPQIRSHRPTAFQAVRTPRAAALHRLGRHSGELQPRRHRRRLEASAPAIVATAPTDEYESARASVNNSHYTEPFIVHWIWAALRRLGFEGGRILDPSSGIGHFLGCMPADIATRSRITAVELDDSGRAHPQGVVRPVGVDVRIQGLEAATLADGTFDLVVSNVPFGNYQVSDGRNRPYSRFSIHNWFVGKALDLVRPGGLVCLITSAWFLDQRDESARAHAASQADLVSASACRKGRSCGWRAPTCSPTS